MKGRNLWILIVVIAVVVGAGGYMFGSRKKAPVTVPATQEQAAVAPTNGGHPPANFPTNYNEVLADLNARLEKEPDNWELHASIGDIYFDMKRFNEAIGYYKKAIEMNPEDADSYNDIALASHYTGNTLEGLRYAEEGLKVDPGYQRIWLTKGFLLAYGLGKREEAVAAWDKAIAIDPESPIASAAEEFKKR